MGDREQRHVDDDAPSDSPSSAAGGSEDLARWISCLTRASADEKPPEHPRQRPLSAHRPLSRRSRRRLSEGWSAERWELGLALCYDRPLGSFFNFIYDILQFSSGRDKLCAFIQGYAKFGSAVLAAPDSERHWMYRGMEDSLSDGRKIFRLFKEFREVYKIRRGISRMLEGVYEDGIRSMAFTNGCLDTMAHSASFLYYLADNFLWAASVGLVRSKEVPRWQRGMWQGFRRNGWIISSLGGVSNLKRKKNFASIWRLNFAIIANGLLLYRASRDGSAFQGCDDLRLFHTLELVGMFTNFSILLSKLGFYRLQQGRLGVLAMLAAVCGIWSNWRKVRRKNCGTKSFAGRLRASSMNGRRKSKENLECLNATAKE